MNLLIMFTVLLINFSWLLFREKKHEEVNSLFNLVSMLVNVVGVSAKCRDILHEKHALAVTLKH